MDSIDKLHLLQWNADHLRALAESKAKLATLLQVTVPAGWPQFPEAYTLPANAGDNYRLPPTEWGGYFFINTQEKTLIGSGGFHTEPDASGSVEIGYEIAPEYWNRGYATLAVRAMLNHAFFHPEVQAVQATTLGEVNASNRVLQKVGMTFVKELVDDEQGTLWRYQIKRETYMRSYT